MTEQAMTSQLPLFFSPRLFCFSHLFSRHMTNGTVCIFIIYILVPQTPLLASKKRTNKGSISTTEEHIYNQQAKKMSSNNQQQSEQRFVPSNDRQQDVVASPSPSQSPPPSMSGSSSHQHVVHQRRHVGIYSDEEAGLLDAALSSPGPSSPYQSAASLVAAHHDNHDDEVGGLGEYGRAGGGGGEEASYSASALLGRITSGIDDDDDGHDDDPPEDAAAAAEALRQTLSAAQIAARHDAHAAQSRTSAHNLQTAVRVGTMTARSIDNVDDLSDVQSFVDVGSIGGVESAMMPGATMPGSGGNYRMAQRTSGAAGRAGAGARAGIGAASGARGSMRDSAYIYYDDDEAAGNNAGGEFHDSFPSTNLSLDEISEEGGGGGGASQPTDGGIKRGYSGRSICSTTARDRGGRPLPSSLLSSSSRRSLSSASDNRSRYTSFANSRADSGSVASDDGGGGGSLLDRVARAETGQNERPRRQSEQQQQQQQQGSAGARKDGDGGGMVQSQGGGWYSAAAAAATGLAGAAVSSVAGRTSAAVSSGGTSSAASGGSSKSAGYNRKKSTNAPPSIWGGNTESTRSSRSLNTSGRLRESGDAVDWTEMLPGSSKIPGEKTRRRRELERLLRRRWFVPIILLLLLLVGLVVFFAVSARMRNSAAAFDDSSLNDGAGRGEEDTDGAGDVFDLGDGPVRDMDGDGDIDEADLAFFSPTMSPAPSANTAAVTHSVPGIADGSDDAAGDGVFSVGTTSAGNGFYPGDPAYLEFVKVGADGEFYWDSDAAKVAGIELSAQQSAAVLEWARSVYLKYLKVGPDGEIYWDKDAAKAAGIDLSAAQIAALLEWAKVHMTYSDGTTMMGWTSDGNSYKTTTDDGSMVTVGWSTISSGGSMAPTPSPSYLAYVKFGSNGEAYWDKEAAVAAGIDLSAAEIESILASASKGSTSASWGSSGGSSMSGWGTTTATTTTTAGGGGAGIGFSADGEDSSEASLKWSVGRPVEDGASPSPTPDPAYLDLVEQYVDETGKVSVRWKFPNAPTPSPKLLDNIEPDPQASAGVGFGFDSTWAERPIEVAQSEADSGSGIGMGGGEGPGAGIDIGLAADDGTSDDSGSAVTADGGVISTADSGPGMVSPIDFGSGAGDEEGAGMMLGGDGLPVINDQGNPLNTNGEVIKDDQGEPIVLQTTDDGKPVLDDSGNAVTTDGGVIPTTGSVTDDFNKDTTDGRPIELAVPYPPPTKPAPTTQPTVYNAGIEAPNIGGGLDTETTGPESSGLDTEFPIMAAGEPDVPMAPGLEEEVIPPPAEANPPVPAPTRPAPAPEPVVYTQPVAPQQVSGGNTVPNTYNTETAGRPSGGYQQPSRVSGGGREQEPMWASQTGIGTTRAPTPAPFILHNEDFIETCVEDYGGSRCYVKDEDHLKHAISHEDDAIYEIYYSNPIKCCGVIVEVGAGNGVEGSVSHFFEYGMHWEAINIEADPEKFKQLTNNRPDAYNYEGGFCSTDHMVSDDKGFYSIDGPKEVMSEKNLGAVADANMATSTTVPCLSLETDILKPLDITHIDVMVIQVSGDPLAVIRKMHWSVRVDIWIILFDGEVGTDSEKYDKTARTVLTNNEYVQAEWDIKRWCGEELNKCRKNEVFLRRGFNPLPAQQIALKRYLRKSK